MPIESNASETHLISESDCDMSTYDCIIDYNGCRVIINCTSNQQAETACPVKAFTIVCTYIKLHVGLIWYELIKFYHKTTSIVYPNRKSGNNSLLYLNSSIIE